MAVAADRRRPPRRRTGRRGSCAAAGPACMIRCAAAAVIATPAALSIAPVPRSQLSRWPPITIMPALGSLPGTSATTLPDWRRADVARRQRQPHPHRPAAVQDALELLGVGQGERARPGSAARPRRSSARRYGGCGDDRCRSSGRRSPPRPCGWRWSGPGGAARRTGRSPSRPGSASYAWLMKTILPRTAASGAASSAATLSKPTTSASIPAAGVAPLLPSAVTTSGCGKGETISARSSPRTQTGMSNGSTWTLAKPSAVSRRTAQSRARASASVPARRGPTSVVSPSTMSQASVSPLQRGVAQRGAPGRRPVWAEAREGRAASASRNSFSC